VDCPKKGLRKKGGKKGGGETLFSLTKKRSARKTLIANQKKQKGRGFARWQSAVSTMKDDEKMREIHDTS